LYNCKKTTFVLHKQLLVSINNKALGNKLEFCLFYLCLLFNIWVIICQPFFPSYDGPAHLYYSRVIDQMVSGNSFLPQYFAFNKIPVPNLADHYLLALFGIFFSSSTSEKLLLLLYFAGLPLCFRYLISYFNPQGKALSILIFPLTHCILFYLGAYNFCLSFTFLLASIIYYIRKSPNPEKVYTPLHYLIFVSLTLLCYFSNGIAFLLLGLTTSIYEICLLLPYFTDKAKQKPPARILYLRYVLFTIAWLPGLVCMYFFNKYIHIPSESTDITFSEHFKWLYDLRPLFIYAKNELTFSRTILVFVVLLFLMAMRYRFKTRTTFRFIFTDTFMLICLISLACFFLIPDGASVGGMCNRFCYYFFFFLILWIALQKTTFKYLNIFSFLIVITHFLFFFTYHYPAIKQMAQDATEIQEASEVIKPNSIVLPISVNANWVEQNFCFYLGLDKPMFISKWYEPDQGWFALKFNPKKPSIGVQYNGVKKPDYIFVLNDLETALTENPEVKEALKPYYTLISSTDYGNIHIYELNHK
jgi:hypothetical protein